MWVSTIWIYESILYHHFFFLTELITLTNLVSSPNSHSSRLQYDYCEAKQMIGSFAK